MTSLFFEQILLQIRGYTISYSSNKKKDRDKREADLKSEISNIDKLIDTNQNLSPAQQAKRSIRNNKKRLYQRIVHKMSCKMDRGR